MGRLTRRQAVLRATSTGAVLLAGCVGSPDSDEATESTDQSDESITADDISFAVRVEDSFTTAHPARMRISLTNQLDTPAIITTGATPPFTSYLSENQSEETQLILVPDVPEAESPLTWTGETNPLPTTPDDGCWNVTQEVMIEDIGTEERLEQGATSYQPYDVYGYQNESCPSSGAYQFEDTLRLFPGQPSSEIPAYQVTLSFTLTLDDEQSLSVATEKPQIKTVDD